MKLTIEPSEPRLNYKTVTIEVESNDLSIGQMFDELIIPALVAAGFSEKKIDEYLGDECTHCGDSLANV